MKSGNCTSLMSKIGKKPVVIPSGVNVTLGEEFIELESPKGKIQVKILPGVKVEKAENQLIFKTEKADKQTRANWGTLRSLVQNSVSGLIEGVVKILQIEGIGYRAAKEGGKLVLHVGYSHPVKYPIPPGINVEVEKNLIKISGIDKQLVGHAAAEIRAIKKPEPYQGKGIRYQDEVITRKAGKKIAGTTGE